MESQSDGPPLKDGASRQPTEPEVVLLNASGGRAGSMGKNEAHQPPGYRHLAVSVVLRNAAGQLLLQRRALTKYHFAGMWANSCCGHPLPGERVGDAALRRIEQELGVTGLPELHHSGSFWYRASDPASGLVEHELDIVLTGTLEGQTVEPHPDEIEDVDWLDRGSALALSTDGRRAVPWLASVLQVALQNHH